MTRGQAVMYGCPPSDFTSPRLPDFEPPLPVLPYTQPPGMPLPTPGVFLDLAEVTALHKRLADLECRLASAEGRVALLEREAARRQKKRRAGGGP